MAVVVEVTGTLDVPVGPGLATPPPPIKLVPFISQIATQPSSFCHRMSVWPSLLKSPTDLTCQPSPGLGKASAADHSAPVGLPYGGGAVVVLPQKIEIAVASEVPTAFACQLEPGFGRLPPPTNAVPLTVQIAAAPVSLCKKMLVPSLCHGRSGLDVGAVARQW